MTSPSLVGKTRAEKVGEVVRIEQRGAKEQGLALYHAIPIIENRAIGCELDSPSAVSSRMKTYKASGGEEQSHATAIRSPQFAPNLPEISSSSLEIDDATAGGKKNKGARRSSDNLAIQVNAVADRLSRLLTAPIPRYSRAVTKNARAVVGASYRWEGPSNTNDIAKAAAIARNGEKDRTTAKGQPLPREQKTAVAEGVDE